MKSISSRLLGNGVAQVLSILLLLVQQLSLVPLFLYYWGVAYYGEWLAISAISVFLATADCGIGSASSNYFSINWFQNDPEMKPYDILKSSLWSVCLVCFLITTIISGVVYVLQSSGLLDASLFGHSEIWWIILFLALGRFSGLFAQCFEGCFRVVGKASRWTYFYCIRVVLEITGVCAALIAGYQAVSVAFVLCVAEILRLCIVIYFASKCCGENRLFSGDASLKIALNVMRKGFSFLIMPLWRGILFQGSIVVTRMTLGPESAALWGTMRMLSRSAVQATMIIEYSTAPELQVELAKGNCVKARNIYRLAVIYGACIGIVGALSLYFLGDFIYAIWTSNSLSLEYWPWLFTILGIIPCCIWSSSSAVLRAANKPEILARWGLVLSVLVCVCIYFLASPLGFVVIPLSVLLLDSVLMLVVVSSSLSVVRDNLKSLMGVVIRLDFMKPRIIREYF